MVGLTGFVAQAANFVVRFDDVGKLFAQKLGNIAGQSFLQSFGILGPSFVLGLFRGREQGTVSAAELRFEVAPGTLQAAGQGAALVDIVHAETMQLILQFGGIPGADLGFFQQKMFGGFIFQFAANGRQAFLAIVQHLND